jgi:single-stranded DNA-binding protein
MQEILFSGILTSEPKTYTVPESQQGLGHEDPPDLTYSQFYVVCGRLKRHGERKFDYYSVKAYNKRGDFVQRYLHKGMKVYVKGELQPEMVERPSGKIDMVLGVRASSVEFLGKRSEINETILCIADEGQEEYLDIAEDLVGW